MKAVKLAVLLIMLIAIGAGGAFWWHHQTLHPSTDDAYARADIVTVAALVGGTVVAVPITENGRVEAGDPMFEIDPAAYRAALDAAEARLATAEQGVGAGGANVTGARAELARAEAFLREAEATLARDRRLGGALSASDLEGAQAARDEAEATRDGASASLEAARATLGDTGDAGGDNAAVRAARADVTRVARHPVPRPIASIPGSARRPGSRRR